MPEEKKCQYQIERKNVFFQQYTCPIPPLEDSDYCILHKPNKTKDEIVLFNQLIRKMLRNKSYHFVGCYFPERVDFANQVFKNNVDFSGATFEGDADFKETIFEKDVYFSGSTFRRDADFHQSIFKELLNCFGIIFNGDVNFMRSSFQGGVNFNKSTFKGDMSFGELIFPGRASFAGSTFEGIAYFRNTIFEEDPDFGTSTFKGDVMFPGATFREDADFEWSTFERYVDFTDATFANSLSAEEAFRAVKSCYQKQGEYTLAGEYYYKERIARRKQLPWYSPKRWLEYILLDGLCGYGERPLRTIRTGLGVLFGLAFLYWKVGHIYPSPELFNEPHTLTFLDALYFSVVTFTTLGFGDWRPDPSHWIRYIVMSEAFIGAFLMALFIVTFARRMMR